MTASPKEKAASKSDLIETILRRQGPLPVRRIVAEMQRMGIEAKPNNVRSLMSTLFKRFASLRPGLWELWDPALNHAEKVILYEESRGREVEPERKALLQALNKPRAPTLQKAAVTSCPRCFKMDVAKEDDWSICLSCGWNNAKELEVKPS